MTDDPRAQADRPQPIADTVTDRSTPFPTLIRYLESVFGLALRPEHARVIREICEALQPPPVEAPPQTAEHPLQQLLHQQEALGPTAAQVLYDNLWHLYESALPTPREDH